MPVTMSAYIRTSPTDNTFGIAPTQNSSPELPKVLTRQTAYRFAGYHLTRDTDGNIVVNLPPSAWVAQPAEWSRKDLLVGTYDFRAP
jgi:hypothetical protein